MGFSRRILGANVVGLVGLLGLVAWMPTVRSDPIEVTVYKSPSCGCCAKWVDHLKANGFKVTVKDMDDLSQVKAEAGITKALASCHTALVRGYVVEGHVPADVIQRMLKEHPKIRGVAAPGMPAGSPGMEGPRKDRSEILSFDAQGRTAVYEIR